MGGINKKFVGNPLGYFRKQKDAQIAKAQAGVETSDVIMKKMTMTNSSKLTDKEKLKMHDEKAKRQLALKAGKVAVTKKNGKTVYRKPKKIQLKSYN
jgi:hypothetical protein